MTGTKRAARAERGLLIPLPLVVLAVLFVQISLRGTFTCEYV
jgi:hypothetical protein